MRTTNWLLAQDHPAGSRRSAARHRAWRAGFHGLGTTPTSMIKRLTGDETWTDNITFSGGKGIAGASPGVPGTGRVVTAITTLAVTQALHEGRIVSLSLLAGFTSTLPAATGSGAIYKFVIGIVNTTNSYIISTAPLTDIFQGTILTGVTTAATGKAWTAGNTDNTLTLNGTTTGGASIGDMIEIIDIAAGVWAVRGHVTAIVGGGLATMFSHT